MKSRIKSRKIWLLLLKKRPGVGEKTGRVHWLFVSWWVCCFTNMSPSDKSQCRDSLTQVTDKARGHLVLLLVMIGDCLEEWAVRAVSSRGQSPSPWAAHELPHVLMYTTSSQGVSYCKFWIYWVGLNFALNILIFLYFYVAM